MKLKLFPKENFDKESLNTMNKLIKIAEELLNNLNIIIPSSLEFYDDFETFIQRILPQVQHYGLTKKQSIEFIKASLNSGSYGTFNIKENCIIEMNFNPYFKLFYPSIHFIRLLIHESLHLFLHNNLKLNIYDDKFKFEKGKYVGKEMIIQLDEGFAAFLTDKILEDVKFELIKEWPIYSGPNKSPSYKKKMEGIDIGEFNRKFNKVYEENAKKGYKIIEKKFNQIEGDLKEKIRIIVDYIKKEILILYEHK